MTQRTENIGGEWMNQEMEVELGLEVNLKENEQRSIVIAMPIYKGRVWEGHNSNRS
jgi:hypothetical protein